MPASNLTSLGLNSWLGADKPKRADFVADNTLLDGLLTQHFGDGSAHLSGQDRQLLTQGIFSGAYDGNGTPTQRIALPFAPRAAFVYRSGAPLMGYDANNDYYRCHAAIVCDGDGSGGAALEDSTLCVYQDAAIPASGGNRYCLNEQGVMYGYILLR